MSIKRLKSGLILGQVAGLAVLGCVLSASLTLNLSGSEAEASGAGAAQPTRGTKRPLEPNVSNISDTGAAATNPAGKRARSAPVLSAADETLLASARRCDAGEAASALAAGANVNINDRYGSTPLMLAVEKYDCLDLILLLLANGADVNRTLQGETALMIAVSDRPILEALIAAGADIDAQNAIGRTALMTAVTDMELRKIKLLLAAGAQVDLQAQDGRTALILAAANDSEAQQTAVAEYGAAEVAKNNLASIAALIRAGANVNIEDAQGWTALMYAAAAGNVDMVCLLLQAGATIYGEQHERLSMAARALIDGWEQRLARQGLLA